MQSRATEKENQNRYVKLDTHNVKKYSIWRARIPLKISQEASLGNIKKSDIQQIIELLKEHTRPLDLESELPTGYGGEYLKYISTPPFDASFNLLRERLIIGFRQFIKSPIVKD